MPSIDERVVAMSFENQVFETRVATTMSTLSKLDNAIRTVGASNGLQNIEAAANKVTLQQPMSALDKLKAKLGLSAQGSENLGNIENAANKVTLQQPMSALDKLKAKLFGSSQGAAEGMGGIETAANKVNLEHPMSALDRLRAKLGRAGDGAAQGMSDIDRAGEKVTLSGPHRAIDKLKAKFGQLSAGTTFTDIEKASDHVTLSGLTRSLDSVTAKFSVLQGAATVALGNISSQAVMRGAAFAKSFSFAPLQQGFQEYQTNLNSIQTILANTQGQQVSGLGEVNKHLSELNTYSDKTIYNFSQMAQNIGTFTAAGVDLDKSTQSIKGIANLAALSGSNSQQASTAMYQLSQAIAAGRVGLQDWNSVVNAGMGGAVFQKALMRTATNMGTVEKGAVKIDKATGKATINGESFRESITAKPGQKSWLTSDVLVKTLGQFTGDLSVAQLKAQGFNAEQIKAIQQTAKTAQAAATEVKTLPQVFDVARETIGSGWAKTFQTIFGNFNQSKKTFTELSGVINGFINTNSDARNKVLGDWAKLGGRKVLIEGIKDAFKALISVIKPIKEAFRDIFPATTGKGLYDLTVRFRDLMESFKIGSQTAEGLKRTFRGFFAIIHIGVTAVKAILGIIGKLFGVIGKGSGGFLGLTGSVGDWLVALDKAISKGNAFGAVFKGIGNVLKTPLEIFKSLAHAIGGLFGGNQAGSGDALASTLGNVASKLGPLTPIVMAVVGAFRKLQDIVNRVKDFLSPLFTTAVQAVSGFGETLANAIRGLKFDNAMAALQTALTGGIFLVLKKAIGGGVDIKFFDGVRKNVVTTLNAVTGSLQEMQKVLQAAVLVEIGAAIALLAAGVLIMSRIDPKRLTPAMTAISVGLGELMAAMKILAAGGGLQGIKMMPWIAASMILMAGALVVLSFAVTRLSKLSWSEIIRGLAGVGGSLLVIAGAMKAFAGAKIMAIALGLIPLGVALNILAVAVKIFASMSWGELIKGLVGMGVALVAIADGMMLMPPDLPLVAVGLVAVGGALLLIAGAVSTFGSMSLGTLAKGLLATGAALVIIGEAMWMFPPNMAISAAGLLIAAAALTVLGGAIAIIGNLKIMTLVKGIVAISVALSEMAIGLTLMAGTLPGAAALMAAALALAVLAPTLAFLGNLEWSTILKGLGAIALLLGTIAVVGLVAAPALLAIGIALGALGVGVALASGGVYILAKGISLLAADGQKGFAVLLTALTAFVAFLPKLIIDFVKGLVAIAGEIAKVAPKVVMALSVIIDELLLLIIRSAPKIATAAIALMSAFLRIINEQSSPFIRAGIKLMLSLLTGIANNIGRVTKTVANIIVRFLDAMTANLPRIIKSGANTIIAFLNGVSSNAGRIVGAAATTVTRFLTGIASQLPRVVTAGVKVIVTFLNQLSSHTGRIVTAGANLIISLIRGLGNAYPRIVAAGVTAIIKLVNALSSQGVRLANAGFNALIHFLNGLARVIRNRGPELRAAGWNVASAIIDGIVGGFRDLAHRAIDAVKGMINALPNAAKHILGIHSPSQVFRNIGGNVMAGLADGIIKSAPLAHASMGSALKGMVEETGDAKQLGGFLGKDFMNGLTGAVDNRSEAHKRIDDSFASLRAKLREEIGKLRDQVKSDRDKLKTELDKDHPSEIVVRRLATDVRNHTALLNSAKGASASLMANLKDEHREMVTLAATFDALGKQLEDAQKTLDDITKAREEHVKATTDQYNSLPDPSSLLDKAVSDAALTAQERADNARKAREEEQRRSQVDQVALYKKAMAEQIAATQKYMATLEKLRALGLDDETYRKLLSEGTKDQSFADQLVIGGKAAVDQINELDAQLLKTSTKLAQDSATNLYKAGVDAAQGLVDGLKARQNDIQGQMNDIAKAMVRSIKRQLGIKSPSREMAKVGRSSVQGLVKGLQSAGNTVTDAASTLGDNATSAMKNSVSGMADALASEIDPNLTIVPVLDLTQMRKDARAMQYITQGDDRYAASRPGMPYAYSVGLASATSGEVASTSQDTSGGALMDRRPIIELTQINQSPDPLSPIEVYRQTQNQLAQLRNSLGMVPDKPTDNWGWRMGSA